MRLITHFAPKGRNIAMNLVRLWQILLPIILVTGTLSAQTESAIAATIDSEIQSLSRQVSDLRTKFSASLKDEEATIEKFLDPNSDPKGIEKQLTTVRERSSKLSDHLADAEDRLRALRKSRGARIRQQMKLAKSQENEETKLAQQRAEQQAREAAAKETELSRQREMQQQAVRLAAERMRRDTTEKVNREAETKIRAVQLLEEARERTERAAETRRERLAKQRAKAERARLKLEEQARARGIDPTAAVPPAPEDAIGSAERLRREHATEQRLLAAEAARRRATAEREALRQQELQQEAARHQRAAEKAQSKADNKGKGFFGRWFGNDEQAVEDSSTPPPPQN
ncbi:MAG: myosin heavy subunit [Rhodothermales bacterium]